MYIVGLIQFLSGRQGIYNPQKMLFGTVLVLILPVLSLAWSVSLDMDSALRSDSHWQESRNSGTYLRDSFRSQVLIPAFQVLVKGLRQNEEEDKVFRIGCLAFVIPIAILLMYALFLLKCKTKSKSGLDFGKGSPSMVLPVTNEKEVETGEFKFRLAGKH